MAAVSELITYAVDKLACTLVVIISKGGDIRAEGRRLISEDQNNLSAD